MATSDDTARDPARETADGSAGGSVGTPDERHVAPIRWPRPSGRGLALFALWAGGAAFGTVAPALLVSPTSDGASTGLLLSAFGLTVVGVLIMVAACVLAFRRGRDGAVIIFAVVPTGVLLAGGLMLLGTKLFSA